QYWVAAAVISSDPISMTSGTGINSYYKSSAFGTWPSTLSSASKSGATFSLLSIYADDNMATGYTLIGPSSGYINVASTNFTVTPNGIYTGTITPTSTGAGTFSPASLT